MVNVRQDHIVPSFSRWTETQELCSYVIDCMYLMLTGCGQLEVDVIYDEY